MPEVHLTVLGILGLCVAGGALGAWVFQRLHVPQVVGYIVIGVLLGSSGFGLIRPADIAALQPFNHFALGLIGFLVGGELQGSMFRKYGRQFTAILFGEGLASFGLVGVCATLITHRVTGDWAAAAAAGVVLGAVASATDPASTIDVLWEYRSAGVLTTAIIAIVALDDALAMTLYGLGTSVANLLVHAGEASAAASLLRTLRDLGCALGLGVCAGFLLNGLVRYLQQQPERRLGISVGLILLCIATAVAFGLDVILSTMAMGIVLVNQAPRRSRKLFELIRSFSAPIYIVFFVLVGARLSIHAMPGWLWGLVAVYVLMRSLGKWAGSYAGGRFSRADPPVRRYIGMALFAQGGVAVGLSIVASHNLQHIRITDALSLGDMIIFTVTTTTLCVQLIGPGFAKLAIRRAGEIGRDVTEEDVMREWTVREAVDTAVVPLHEGTPLDSVLRHFAEQDALVFPVVSAGGAIIGVLTLDLLKEVLMDRDSWHWLVVGDVMQPVQEVVAADRNLGETLQDMRDMQVEALPVITSRQSGQLLGVLDQREARRRVGAEIVRRQTVRR